MSRLSALTRTSYVLLIGALVLGWLGLTSPAEGQRRSPTETPSSFDDVVFAISFSPDARTLAIARGASDPVHRYGRIELWDTETGKLRHVIKGFDGPVRSISFLPDGHTLISSSNEFRSPKIQRKARSREGETFGELKWWDARTGELKQKVILPREGSYRIRATQSPDGKQLALAETFREQSYIFPNATLEPLGAPGRSLGISRASYWPRTFFKEEVKLVDAQTGELRFKLNVGQTGAASFSPDGKLLAVSNGNGIKLWDCQTGKEVGKLKSLRGDANALAFSPSGRTLAVASIRFEREHGKEAIKIIGISEVTLFDVSTGKVTLKLNDLGAVNTLAFSPDSTVLIVGGVLPKHKGDVAGMTLIDLQTWKQKDLHTGADYKEAVDSLAFSSNGGLLAFRSGPATVQLFDTQNETVKHSWDANSVGDAVERPSSRFLLSVKRVLAVAFSADGLTVTGESDQGEIKLWDHRTGEVKRRLNNEQEDGPSLVAASTDGRLFAEVSQGKLLLWDVNSDTKRLIPLPGPHLALALSADGRMLAVGGVSEITLLSPTGEVAKKLNGQQGSVNRLAFSQDGSMLAGADQDGTIKIWKLPTGGVEKTIIAANEITAMVFAPNGETLATAASDNTIALWNLQTGLAQGRLQKHAGIINALAFSPNGQLLVSGADDRTIVLWEVAAGKSKHTFKGHDQTVTSLAFSPNGQLLASGSGNASVVLWEVETGKLSRVLR